MKYPAIHTNWRACLCDPPRPNRGTLVNNLFQILVSVPCFLPCQSGLLRVHELSQDSKYKEYITVRFRRQRFPYPAVWGKIGCCCSFLLEKQTIFSLQRSDFIFNTVLYPQKSFLTVLIPEILRFPSCFFYLEPYTLKPFIRFKIAGAHFQPYDLRNSYRRKHKNSYVNRTVWLVYTDFGTKSCSRTVFITTENKTHEKRMTAEEERFLLQL